MTRSLRVARTAVARLRERGPAVLTRLLRLTGAALLSYLVAGRVVDDPRPVTAALTALLVVQVTLVGTFTDTLRRVVSVFAGVVLAIGVSLFVGFTWWSLGAVIAASILLGQALRLGPHLLEVPISAMLILAVGGQEALAWDRIIETLIGAGAGLLLNLAFPPAVQTRTAGAAVEQFAHRMGQLLDRAAESLATGQATRNEVRHWLDDARTIAHDIVGVDAVLTQAGQSRRLNPRAVGTVDTTPDLRSGLDSLEHAAVALRAVFRSIADVAGDASDAADQDGVPAEFDDEDLRAALATMMSDLAAAVRGFGTLVRAEVDRAEEPHTADLAEALRAVGEARARLTELLMVDARDAPGQWQSNGALLAGMQRVLAELDVEHRTRERQRRRDAAEARRRPAAQAAERLRSRARSVARDRPVRIQPPRR
ncbi:MAG: hypothetical protein QOC66_2477 [Pseudonocardiales bacterium]|nr:hypothetical protein [Pseudonocardiales bacterium]